MTWIVVISSLAFLILINSLFVAAEFSSVSARRTRLVQLASQGNRLARSFLPVVKDRQSLDNYIAACQLGITASSLILGFYGQAQLTPVISPYFSNISGWSITLSESVTSTVVLISLTTLQVVFGELLPKSIGVLYPERLALLTAIPMRWSTLIFKPFISIFNGSGRAILRLFGKNMDTEQIHIHSPEEILILFEESTSGGLLDKEERRLLRNSLELRKLVVRQVMMPRNRMLAASADTSCQEMLNLLAHSPFSRLPLFENSIDNIIGIVHLKDLLCLQIQTGQSDIRKAMRPVLFVPEMIPVDQVFSLLQKKHRHVAIVLDEFGGTAGIVTLEDLIEEIFGEMKDEFDIDTQPFVKILSPNKVQVRGDILINDLNEMLDLYLSDESVDTIGGLVLDVLGHIPQVGETFHHREVTFKVETMDGKGISMVSLEVSPEKIQHLKEWLQ
jgi:putative hemolysin